eukprot:gene14130-14961_t
MILMSLCVIARMNGCDGTCTGRVRPRRLGAERVHVELVHQQFREIKEFCHSTWLDIFADLDIKQYAAERTFYQKPEDPARGVKWAKMVLKAGDAALRDAAKRMLLV